MSMVANLGQRPGPWKSGHRKATFGRCKQPDREGDVTGGESSRSSGLELQTRFTVRRFRGFSGKLEVAGDDVFRFREQKHFEAGWVHQ